MDNSGAIYLSASIPNKEQEGFETADSFWIRSAVNDFIDVVLGRKVIVMEVHQAVTRMIKFMAKENEVDFQEYVELYQSEYLRKLNPEENPDFEGVHLIKEVNGDEKASLRKMRESMFTGAEYSAAVFIGGSEGVREEYELFHQLNPDAKRVLIPSPGGVTQSLFEELEDAPEELENSIDFLYWFCELLDIDLFEERGSHAKVKNVQKQESDKRLQREQRSEELRAVLPSGNVIQLEGQFGSSRKSYVGSQFSPSVNYSGRELVAFHVKNRNSDTPDVMCHHFPNDLEKLGSSTMDEWAKLLNSNESFIFGHEFGEDSQSENIEAVIGGIPFDRKNIDILNTINGDDNSMMHKELKYRLEKPKNLFEILHNLPQQVMTGQLHG